ncbi:hypothetical protein LTR17_027158 [Elasticomyces elasticus]|nr:hypothetical protein LTR17_027158 [Elasticomyces elasticus]
MSYISDFNRLLNSDRVIIEVGSNEQSKSYKIPKGILCTIPWFDRALQDGGFREGTEGKITLPEDDPASFEMFQYLLFNGRLHFESISAGDDPKTDLESELGTCVKAWIFGDKYSISDLQNCVMARMCDIFLTKEILLPVQCVITCYGSTVPGSPLRVLAAECVMQQIIKEECTIGAYEGAVAHG